MGDNMIASGKFYYLIIQLVIFLAATHGFIKHRVSRQLATGPHLAAALVTSMTPPTLKQLPATMDPKLIQYNRLLVDLWEKIAFPTTSTDDSDTIFRLKDYALNRQDLKGFLKHFQVCKDCAGDSAFLMATKDASGDDILQLSNVDFPVTVEDDEDDEWGNFDEELLKSSKDEVYVPPFPTEENDEVVMADTKEWVRRVIADFNVCPFTVDPNKAGIPMGGVRYTVSRALTPDEAFLRFWEEVRVLFTSGERDMSTILLVFPEVNLFGSLELFEQYCESLNDALCSSSMCMESQIQLVFFHPKYAFRDGQARASSDAGAANFARRGPWPMVNILRTPQVALAQKGIPTGQVYKQNEERLAAVGAETLERMLFSRDWAGLPIHSSTAAARIIRETALKQQEEQEARVRAEAEAAGACPFPHGKTVSALSTLQPDAASNALPVECPVKQVHPPVNALKANSNSAASDDEAFLKSLVDSTEPQAAEDLMRLADEIEKWMASGGL